MTKLKLKVAAPNFFGGLSIRWKKIKGEGKRAVVFEFLQFLLIIGILSGFLFFLFLNAKFLQASLFEKRKLIAAVDERIASEARLREDSKIVQDALDRMHSLFPSQDDLPTFLNRVEEILGSFGASVTINLGEKGAGDGVATLPFTVETNLTLSTLRRFFESLGSLPYIIQMQTFEIISPEGIEKSAGKVKMRGTLFMR